MRRNNKELELKENISKLIAYCIGESYNGNTIDYNIFFQYNPKIKQQVKHLLFEFVNNDIKNIIQNNFLSFLKHNLQLLRKINFILDKRLYRINLGYRFLNLYKDFFNNDIKKTLTQWNKIKNFTYIEEIFLNFFTNNSFLLKNTYYMLIQLGVTNDFINEALKSIKNKNFFQFISAYKKELLFLEKIVLHIKINRKLYIESLNSLQNKLKIYRQFLLSKSNQLNTIDFRNKFHNLTKKIISINLEISKLKLDYIQINYRKDPIEVSIITITRLLNIIKIKPFVFSHIQYFENDIINISNYIEYIIQDISINNNSPIINKEINQYYDFKLN